MTTELHSENADAAELLAMMRSERRAVRDDLNALRIEREALRRERKKVREVLAELGRRLDGRRIYEAAERAVDQAAWQRANGRGG